jgi:hypothetical protein
LWDGILDEKDKGRRLVSELSLRRQKQSLEDWITNKQSYPAISRVIRRGDDAAYPTRLYTELS